MSPHTGSGYKSLHFSAREWACLAESCTSGQQPSKTQWFQYLEPWAMMPCFQTSKSAWAVSNHSTGCVFVFQVRSEVIATYALCGFANFGSLGLVIGGLSKHTPHGWFIWQANPKENTWRNRLWVKLSRIRGWAATLPRPLTELYMEGLPEGHRLWCGCPGRGSKSKGKEPSPADRPPHPAFTPWAWATTALRL